MWHDDDGGEWEGVPFFRTPFGWVMIVAVALWALPLLAALIRGCGR